MLRLDWNMVITMINLIVLCLLLKKFLIGPVTAVMEQRQAQIEQQLQNASDAQEGAMTLKTQYEEKLKTSRDETDQILLKARADARAEYDRIVQDAGRKAGRIIEDAKQTAAQEQDKTLRDAQSQIAGLAMAAAARIISAGSDTAGNQLLYDQFLAKAGVTDESSLN